MNGVTTSMSAGTVTVDGVQFLNLPNLGSSNSAPLNLTGTAHVILTPGGLSPACPSRAPRTSCEFV